MTMARAASEVRMQSPPQEQKEELSYASGLFNTVNILMGVGILSIPYTLREGGWSALLVYAILWASTKYTGKILIKCQDYGLGDGSYS